MTSQEKLLAALGLSSTACARCGHESVRHTRLADCVHSKHPVPCQSGDCLCPQFVPLTHASYLLTRMALTEAYADAPPPLGIGT